MLAFEESEFYKAIMFLKKGGIAFINTPLTKLPDPIENVVKTRRLKLYLIDADKIAHDENIFQSANMALLGCFASCGIGPFKPHALEKIIRTRVPEKFREQNIAVFRKGWDYRGHIQFQVWSQMFVRPAGGISNENKKRCHDRKSGHRKGVCGIWRRNRYSISGYSELGDITRRCLFQKNGRNSHPYRMVAQRTVCF